MTTINERLNILEEGKVISPEAALIAEKAVQRLISKSTDLPQNKLEMLVTHLATALTRMSRGEKIDQPAEVLVSEVDKNEHVQSALDEIKWVETVWGEKLPPAEIAFLKIHYVSIFQELKEDQSQ